MKTLAIALLATVVGFAGSARAGDPEPGFSDTAVAPGLSEPTALAFLPDGTFIVTQKGGDVVLVDGATQTTLGTIDVCADSEMGLLGIAIDPSFGTNGFIYLYRTNGSATCGSSTNRFNEVVRVTKSGSTLTSQTTLLTGIRTDGGNHDGGVLRIGPDGKLYVGVGDTGNGDNQGGPGSSTNPYAQDLSSLNGKILRINLDGTIPADNPFFGQVGKRGEIFAYGFRNPFRMSFDPATGSLWVGDVGDLTVEEIDIVTSGGNYGWPVCEGNLPTGCAMPGFIAPIFTNNHGAGSLGGCLIGGTFAGSALGAFDGQYFFGDCNSSNVYKAVVNGTRDDIVGTPTVASSNAGTPADFVEGPDGAIYYPAVGGGDVRRLAATPLVTADELISGKTLSLKLNPNDATKKTATVTGQDPAITLGNGNGSSDDPVVGGGSLRIVSGTFDSTYSMPAGSWAYVGKPGAQKGYKYKDSTLTNGPIKTAMVKPGKLVKASGKGGALGHTLGTDPDPVSIVLTTGNQKYCMSFGGTTKFKQDRSFTAKNAPAPGACPP